MTTIFSYTYTQQTAEGASGKNWRDALLSVCALLASRVLLPLVAAALLPLDVLLDFGTWPSTCALPTPGAWLSPSVLLAFGALLSPDVLLAPSTLLSTCALLASGA